MASPKARLILSIIKLTLTGKVEEHQLDDEIRLPSNFIRETLNALMKEDQMKKENGVIKVSPEQRIALTIIAVAEGADIEEVCKVLGWSEFEELVKVILDYNGFKAEKHFRFKTSERRYEIDVLGMRGTLVFAVDCKHWKRSWQRAATIKAVEEQVERTVALTTSFPNLRNRLDIRESMKVLPLIITLSEAPLKIFNGVPIVSIYRFQNFLNEVETYYRDLLKFTVNT